MMNSYNSLRSKISIVADDFGASPRANRNILYLISIGKIDRVSVMTNGNSTIKEIAELNRSQVKIDIHLNKLNEPCHENKRQCIFRIFKFIVKFLLGKITTSQIEKDWRQQIETFRELFGRNPDGLNSHGYVHFFPLFFKIALKLGAEYNIPYIRFGNTTVMRNHAAAAYALHYLRLINFKNYNGASCITSNSLVSLSWLKDIDLFLDNLPDGTVEIVCHPELAEEFVKIKKYF